MTIPANLWTDERGRRRHRLPGRDQVLSRRRARQMSRRFADVGVGIPAVRLQAIAAGAPAASSELVDVQFALAASQIQREERVAKFHRTRRRGIQCLLVAGLILAALNLLLCMAYVFISLVLHEPPF
ncbi:hypothetical protein BST37_07060 [Mycobacterium noviomagense]|uniref:Uncharacterized protein n=2 Tax=Mycobacterium noviomagense TaxID=459858 RepID=A0ABX3T7U4_9MYCO|nr:hypothetical protein BST37_07060 [Mycobacterium noviomagense]